MSVGFLLAAFQNPGHPHSGFPESQTFPSPIPKISYKNQGIGASKNWHHPCNMESTAREAAIKLKETSR
jgi:hypothetical protein